MSLDNLRKQVAALQAHTAQLAVLASRLQRRVQGKSAPDWLEGPLDAVATATGLDAMVDGVEPSALAPILAEIRTFAHQTHALMQDMQACQPGWTVPDAALLDAAGDASAGVARALAERIAPQLPGLAERLAAPDAAFLDVGVGVGSLAIGMARQWPQMHITGIDPFEPALARARHHIAEAGLGSRITVRQQGLEALDETAAFDLAWVPGAFVPQHAIEAGLPRLFSALRPGGWLLIATLQPGPDAATTALAQLRTALFGGSACPATAHVAALRLAGFTEARALPTPPTSLVAFMAARK